MESKRSASVTQTSAGRPFQYSAMPVFAMAPFLVLTMGRASRFSRPMGHGGPRSATEVPRVIPTCNLLAAGLHRGDVTGGGVTTV